MATGLDFRDRLQLPTRAQRKGKAASGATKNDPPTETPMQEPEDQEEEQAVCISCRRLWLALHSVDC